jgi:hypothetical protein
MAFPQGRVARRPVLQIALVNGPYRLSCYALVDSGADHCAFPKSFLRPLGLPPLGVPFESTAGVGAITLAFFHHVTLDLGVVQLPLYAGFTDGLEQWGMGLLGQNGFFDRLKVDFELSRGLFYIETSWL